MTIGTVIDHLFSNYQYATRHAFDLAITKPYSWALIETYNWVNEHEKAINATKCTGRMTDER